MSHRLHSTVWWSWGNILNMVSVLHSSGSVVGPKYFMLPYPYFTVWWSWDWDMNVVGGCYIPHGSVLGLLIYVASLTFHSLVQLRKHEHGKWVLHCSGICPWSLNRLHFSLVELTLWIRRAGLAAYANRGPETRRAGFPAFAMVCQKPEEHLNRRT